MGELANGIMNQPAALLFITLMMGGVFYLIKYFLDTYKAMMDNVVKGLMDQVTSAISHLDSTVQNNTVVVKELVELVEEMKRKHGKT